MVLYIYIYIYIKQRLNRLPYYVRFGRHALGQLVSMACIYRYVCERGGGGGGGGVMSHRHSLVVLICLYNMHLGATRVITLSGVATLYQQLPLALPACVLFACCIQLVVHSFVIVLLSYILQHVLPCGGVVFL